MKPTQMDIENDHPAKQNGGEKQIVEEIDLIYVPFRSPIHVLQFPIQEKDNQEFDKYLQVSHCDYRTLQKRLDIHYKLRAPIENFSIEEEISRRNMDGMLSDEEDEDPKKKQDKNVAVTYTSKLVCNQTNYFATKYDPITKQLMCYSIDSFLQMRPKLVDKEEKREKDNIKNFAKLSKEKERDEQLIKKHPKKYQEMKLKNFNSFKEIYDSEEPIRLNYHEKINLISDKRFRCFSEPPKEIIPLVPVTKNEYQENLETGGLNMS
ncbi:hypothetical protein ABPG72_018000 [Tetrahymena utriculariae]